jgi:hypothetical protein
MALTRQLRGIAFAFWILACHGIAHPQTLTIRLINGKSGKPMRNKNLKVTFWWENPAIQHKDKWSPLGDQGGTEVNVGKTGEAQIQIPPNATKIEVEEGLKAGKEPYRVPYFDCNDDGFQMLSLDEVLRQGFVHRNSCSQKLKVVAVPGQIVLFAMPTPWWKPDFQ